MYNLIKKLYPICRSITGEGVRESLNIIKGHISINIKEISSGTNVYDWKIPDEWNNLKSIWKDMTMGFTKFFFKNNMELLISDIGLTARKIST